MGYKMKGSTLYGKLKLNRDGYENLTDGRSKSSAFQKTDKTPSEKHDKQQTIANPEGGTWKESGRPKTYKTLQPDGTYKVVTNPSGEQSKTAEELKDTHVTQAESDAAEERDVQSIVSKANKKAAKKQKRKEKVKKVKKKIVSAIKDPLGIKARKKKRQAKAYQEAQETE